MKMIAIKIAYMFFVGMLLMLVVVGTLVFADRYMDINLGGVFYFGPVVLFFLFSMLSNTGFSKKSVCCLQETLFACEAGSYVAGIFCVHSIWSITCLCI